MSEPVYTRSEKAIAADVGEDIVALNVERGFTYGMANVAATVWQLLSQPRTLSEICRELTERYDVHPTVCRKEIAQFLNDMIDEELVERRSVTEESAGL